MELIQSYLRFSGCFLTFGLSVAICGLTLGQEAAEKPQQIKDAEKKEAGSAKPKDLPKPTAPAYIRQSVVTGKVTDVNDEKHCIVLEVPLSPKNKVQATFIVTEDAKIRTRVIPTLFDDRGNLKKPTSKELMELKGKDKNLPGYESEFANLKRGQVLLVHQVTTKDKLLADRQKPRPRPGEKPKNEEYLAGYIEIISEN